MITLNESLRHPVVEATLTEAGWTKDRKFRTHKLRTELAKQGFSVLDSAMNVLGSFGGLTLVPPLREGAAFGTGSIVFDPILAASNESSRIRRREQELGVRLCPVGEWLEEYVLLVAEDGRVFAETTFQVLYLGRDFDNALLLLVVADRPPDVVGS